MNWPFRSLRPAYSEHCEDIEPLLSLYADGMASPDETRRAQAHLADCGDCRDALAWMQATQQTLAARPVVAPPPDLHSRIALAIAASTAAPIKLRPARTFALRSSYTAAASLTALGVALSYMLWPAPSEKLPSHPVQPTYTASLPVAKTGPKSHVPPSFEKKTPLVASTAIAAPKTRAVKSLPVVKRMKPLISPASEKRVASAAPTPAVPVVPLTPRTVKAPIHAAPHNLVASVKKAPAETRLPKALEKSITLKLPPPVQVAARPQPAVPVHILPAMTTVQPPVQTASLPVAPPPSKYADIIGPARAEAEQLRRVRIAPYLTTHQTYRDAENVMHTLDTEHFAYLDGIHTR